MYCKKCGTEINNGQTICPKCGTPYFTGNGVQGNTPPPFTGPSTNAGNSSANMNYSYQTPQESPTKKYLLYGGIGCAVLAVLGIGFFLFMLVACNSCKKKNGTYKNNENTEVRSNNESDIAPSWIQGTWYCVTPYGTAQLEIVGDRLRFIDGGADIYANGKYSINGNKISFVSSDGIGTYLMLDNSTKRIVYGSGYYFTKQ